MSDRFSGEQKAFYEELQSSGAQLCFNGINGATGEYGVPPMTGEELANVIKGESPPENLGELEAKKVSPFPVKPPNDPTRLDEAGWAIILPAETDPNVKAALSELLELRQEQAGERFKIYEGDAGYGPAENRAGATQAKATFFKRHQIGGGPADPEEMPYYVLIVGSPDKIPYEFQYQLDVIRGVGRIYFDTPDEYARYARSVVMAETGQVKLPRRASFFGVANPDDKATELSSRHLIRPLYEKLRQQQPFALWVGDETQRTKLSLDWQFEQFIAEQATKAQLERLLGGDQTPTLLFTASHGMEFPLDDPLQISHQGALLCQDWPGPNQWRGKIPQDFYLAGDDLTADTNLTGLIAFHFACFSAGTPRLDQFAQQTFRDERAVIAPHNFVGALPKSLLSHGALAVVGHVERAWGYSILSPGTVDQTGVFESALLQLFRQDPVGWVTENLNMRYADLATQLTANLEYKSDSISPYDLAQMWTEQNDARSYVVIGDPAARLPIALPDETPIERPALPTISVSTAPPADTTPAPSAEGPPVESPADAESFAEAFGLREQFDDLTGSVKKFTDQLATALSKAATDILTLEVKTYATDDLDKVAQGDESQARLRALTRVDFDGDMRVYVPEKGSGVDQELWKIHAEMVQEAQSNRAQFMQTMAEMATNLLKSLT
ncbi:MAG: hypothetical protein SXV54_15370 [Chloroflexota bacterium]|nr:hypothetical protein [Chloroflexota bacterium]